MTDTDLIRLSAEKLYGVSLTAEEHAAIAQILERMRANLRAMRPGPCWTTEPADVVRVWETPQGQREHD